MRDEILPPAISCLHCGTLCPSGCFTAFPDEDMYSDEVNHCSQLYLWLLVSWCDRNAGRCLYNVVSLIGGIGDVCGCLLATTFTKTWTRFDVSNKIWNLLTCIFYVVLSILFSSLRLCQTLWWINTRIQLTKQLAYHFWMQCLRQSEVNMIRKIPTGIGAWRAKREIVSFRVVRACARCLCEVRSGWKSQGGFFPFPFLDLCEVRSGWKSQGGFFPSALQGPIQLQLALSVFIRSFCPKALNLCVVARAGTLLRDCRFCQEAISC